MSTATIAYATECSLCHKKQTNAPLDIPVVGDPGRFVQEFMRKLAIHVNSKHETEFAQGLALLQQYQTFLLMSVFTSEDPSFQAVFEGMRADIFRRCVKNVPTDADLDTLADGCHFEMDADRKKARDAMQAIRDLCCELGAAAPQTPKQGQIVVPAR